MKRKVPYVIVITTIMTLLALSSTLASAADFGAYADQEIYALDASLVGSSNAVTLLCRWSINIAATQQSNLTVNILVDGTVVGRNLSANSYPLDGTAWKLTNANQYFAPGTHTIRVQFVNTGEVTGSNGANNNKEKIVAPDSEWYATIVNGFGWITAQIESVTDQVPFLSDLPIIGSYMPMIIVLIIVVIVIWLYLRRKKKKKLAAGRPPAVYRPPAPYEPPVQQYYRR